MSDAAFPHAGRVDFSRDGRDRVLTAGQWLPADAETLWRFVGDCRHMNHVIPRWVRFEIVSEDLSPVREGMTYEYRLRLRGVPVFWRTLITEVDRPRRFVDVQAKGPYAAFEHTHTFASAERNGRAGTEVGDVIRYRPPGGPLAGLVNVVVRRELRLLFLQRHRRLRELYETLAAGGADPAEWLETESGYGVPDGT